MLGLLMSFLRVGEVLDGVPASPESSSLGILYVSSWSYFPGSYSSFPAVDAVGCTDSFFY